MDIASCRKAPGAFQENIQQRDQAAERASYFRKWRRYLGEQGRWQRSHFRWPMPNCGNDRCGVARVDIKDTREYNDLSRQSPGIPDA